MAKSQKTPLIELRFPLGGLNRQAGFDQQPPYTTPYCQNVRPFDVVNLTNAQMHGYRARGGARPGLSKAYAQAFGSGPIQMMDYASVVSSAGAVSNILLAVSGGTVYWAVSSTVDNVVGTTLNTTAQLRGTQVGQKYYIADFRPTLLSGTDGTIASNNRLSDATLTDAVLDTIDTSLDVVWISGSVDVESNIFPIASKTHGSPGYLTLGNSGTMTNQTGKVTWQIGRIVKVFDPTLSDHTTALKPLMDSLPIPASNYNVGMISMVNGWGTLTGGTWTNVPTNAAAVSLTLSVGAASGIGQEQYAVQSIGYSSGAWHFQLVDSTSGSDRTLTQYPSGVQYTLSWSSGYYGIPPLNCPLCCTYRGRLVLAGGTAWYMSRVLNPNDWDYGYDPQDPSRAIAGTSTTAGGIPDPITALIPHSDSYLIFGCENSLWLLTADPAYGGTIQSLSRDIGVISSSAWCNIPDGSLVFLSRDGLYYLPSGAQSAPQSVSRTKLPYELLNVDTTANRISMCYDVEARGIHLAITPNAGTAGIHYFIDWTTQSYWPMKTTTAAIQPTAMVRYAATPATSPVVIFGSYDGYARKYLSSQTTDVKADNSTDSIVSFVCYGPFRVGGPGYNGEILQLSADMDANGQAATWSIYTADTAQGAVQAAVTGSTPKWTGTLSVTSGHRQYPRAVGGAAVIVVSGTYGWAIEGMRIETKRVGPIR